MTHANFQPVRKAVFPVAGLGTRFLPATKAMPKEMLTINDRPLIEHVFQEAKAAGIEQFIFVTGRHKELLEEHFDYQPELEYTLRKRGKDDMLAKVQESEMPAGSLFLTRQPKPLGLGHAVWCARKLIGDEPFAVLLPDVLMRGEMPCLQEMVETYNEVGGNVIAVEDVPRDETEKYGIVDTGGNQGRVAPVKALVEKPSPPEAPSTLSVVGRYILQPKIFDHLSAFETGAGGEIQLTDAMSKLIDDQPFNTMRYSGKSYDCGSRLGFIEANLIYAMEDDKIGDGVKEMLKAHADKLLNHEGAKKNAA